MADDNIVGEIIHAFSDKKVEDDKCYNSNLDKKNSRFKVSYYVANEETKDYIKELNLDNPIKLVSFLVDTSFSIIETALDSINEIKKERRDNLLNKLTGITQVIKHGVSSKVSCEKMQDYQEQLILLRNELEGGVKRNIQEIVKIDNMTSFERKIKAAFIKKNVDLYTTSAQAYLQAVMEVVKLHIFIAIYTQDDNFMIIRNDIDTFMNEVVFSGNTISIMNDWATKENRIYWSDKLRKEYVQIIEQKDGVLELFEDIINKSKKQKVDLEDIVFE